MGKKKDQEQEEKTPERTETPEGGVEVSLEEETEIQPQEEVIEPEEKEVEPKVTPKPQETEEAKLKNRLGYQERQIGKLQREIEELKVKPPVQATPEPVPADEIDKLAQTDWKAAVRKLGAEEAQRILQEERSRINEQSQVQQVNFEIEKNAQIALTRHPELAEEGSEKAGIWFHILNQNPRWRSSPDGPLLTMYKLEEELRSRGYEVNTPQVKKKETDTERFVRANTVTLPPSRPVNTAGKITLTKEQRDLCDLNGIKYEDYARTLSRGGSEVAL